VRTLSFRKLSHLCRKIRDLAWYARKNRHLIRLGYRRLSSLEIPEAVLGNWAVVAEAFAGGRGAIVAPNIGSIFSRMKAALASGVPVVPRSSGAVLRSSSAHSS
jgi:hypothetical protein